MRKINIKSFKVPVILFLLLTVVSVVIILFIYQNKNINSKFYIKNGLIYNSGNNDIYSGKIIDTVNDKIIEYNVLDGLKNGEFVIRYLNGNYQIKGMMKDNKNFGEWKYYYASGQLESIGTFKDDVVSDEWVWFYENGKRKENGNFVKGKREGRWNMYDENGNLKSILYFNNGRMITKFEAQESKAI